MEEIVKLFFCKNIMKLKKNIVNLKNIYINIDNYNNYIKYIEK